MRRALLMIVGGLLVLFLAAAVTGGLHGGPYVRGERTYFYFNAHLGIAALALAVPLLFLLYLALRPSRRLCPRCGQRIGGRKRVCPRCGVYFLSTGR
jgi:hypothetical protein